MTNVPGAGFLVVLTALVSAGVVVGVSVVAVVTYALTDHPFWKLMGGVYVSVGLIVGAALVSQWGLASTGLGILVTGVVGYLGAGLLFYVVLVSPGLVLVQLLFTDISWDEAAYYATIGWLGGNLAGTGAILLLAARWFAGVWTGVGLLILGLVAGGPLAAKLLHTPTTSTVSADHS